MSAKVKGLPELEAKMRKLIGEMGEKTIAKANQKSADEMMSMVRFACPQGSDAGGHLASTVRKWDGGPLTVYVGIGDDQHRYAAHLELGHKMPNGEHIPGKQFWYPALRVVRKRNHDRLVRAERAAIRAAVGSSTTMPT